MRLLLLFLILIISSHQSFSQKDAYNWYFGRNAGITFLPNGGPPVALTNGNLYTEEGSASISDKDGKLLFYTDGVKVWNASHRRMPNGYGLKGDVSSTHSALIIPLPGSKNTFYIFTVGNELRMNGFQYSIVDMEADGGKGDIVTKNTMINSNSTERVAAVKHSNGTDIWVIMHEDNNAVFKSYLLTETGIDMKPVISTIGTPHDGLGGNIIGYMKVYPDGKKLAVAIMWKNMVDFFDFNNCTGELSNPISLQSNLFRKAYGIEFSPDGTKLYIAGTDMSQTSIYQVDLSAWTQDEIMNSVTEIGRYSNYVGAMQLGPDGKIYVGKWDTWLGIINDPNVKGVMCNYDNMGVNLLGKSCRYGLPTFVRSGLTNDDCCDNTVDFKSFDDDNEVLNDLELIGESDLIDNKIILTPPENNVAGAAWFNRKVSLSNGFSTKFQFRMEDGYNSYNDGSIPGADGIAFVIQNSGPDALGNVGGGIGYEDIPNSIAVEFDTYLNYTRHDPNGNHVAVFTNGLSPISSNHSTTANLGTNADILDIIPDGRTYYVKIDYVINPYALKVYIDSTGDYNNLVLEIDSIDINQYLDLSQDCYAFIGITSATGDSREKHELLGLEYCSSPCAPLDVEYGNGNRITVSTYPNPSNRNILINFNLDTPAFVNLKIYNILGGNEDVLMNSVKDAGNYEVLWNATNRPSGVYMYLLSTSSGIETGKIIIRK